MLFVLGQEARFRKSTNLKVGSLVWSFFTNLPWHVTVSLRWVKKRTDRIIIMNNKEQCALGIWIVTRILFASDIKIWGKFPKLLRKWEQKLSKLKVFLWIVCAWLVCEVCNLCTVMHSQGQTDGLIFTDSRLLFLPSLCLFGYLWSL